MFKLLILVKLEELPELCVKVSSAVINLDGLVCVQASGAARAAC